MPCSINKQSAYYSFTCYVQNTEVRSPQPVRERGNIKQQQSGKDSGEYGTGGGNIWRIRQIGSVSGVQEMGMQGKLRGR